MTALTREEIIACMACVGLIACDLRREKRTIDYKDDGLGLDDLRKVLEKLIAMRDEAK